MFQEKNPEQVVVISADKAEITRLRGELDVAHRAYLAATDRFTEINLTLSKQTEVIQELREEILRQAPRLDAARQFFSRMAEVDLHEHRDQS